MYSSGTDNVRPVSSTVTYSCVDGYILNGGSTRTCLSDGMWSGEEPTCDGNYYQQLVMYVMLYCTTI